MNYLKLLAGAFWHFTLRIPFPFRRLPSDQIVLKKSSTTFQPHHAFLVVHTCSVMHAECPFFPLHHKEDDYFSDSIFPCRTLRACTTPPEMLCGSGRLNTTNSHSQAQIKGKKMKKNWWVENEGKDQLCVPLTRIFMPKTHIPKKTSSAPS